MDWSLITSVLAHVLDALPLFVAVLGLLVLARYFFTWTTQFDLDQEILVRRNPAAGIVFAAYLLGVAVALSGTFFGASKETFLTRFGELWIEGTFMIGLLRLSIWVNDRFILSRFCVVKEIREDRNLGAAFCLAGSSIAGGLILNGALSGYSGGFLLGLRDIVLFWLLGQAVLVLGGYVYQWLTRYDVHQLIEYDDNAAVGVGFGGFLVGLGVIVRSSLVGAGMDVIGVELLQTAVLAVIGVGVMIAVQSLAWRLLLPKANYEEDVEMSGNMAVSVMVACATVGVAILLGEAIQR